jgi:hypothetical protein
MQTLVYIYVYIYIYIYRYMPGGEIDISTIWKFSLACTRYCGSCDVSDYVIMPIDIDISIYHVVKNHEIIYIYILFLAVFENAKCSDARSGPNDDTEICTTKIIK